MRRKPFTLAAGVTRVRAEGRTPNDERRARAQSDVAPAWRKARILRLLFAGEVGAGAHVVHDQGPLRAAVGGGGAGVVAAGAVFRPELGATLDRRGAEDASQGVVGPGGRHAPAAAVLADLLSDWQPLRSAAPAVVISPSRANVIGHRRPARPVWLLACLDMVDPFPSNLIRKAPDKTGRLARFSATSASRR